MLVEIKPKQHLSPQCCSVRKMGPMAIPAQAFCRVRVEWRQWTEPISGITEEIDQVSNRAEAILLF